jgi:hypothetical protein
MFSAPFLTTLLDRVKAIVRRVSRPAAELMRTAPVDAAANLSSVEPISPVLRGLVRDWMSAKLRALSALMRRIEAGDTLDAPIHAPPPGQEMGAPRARTAVAQEQRLPRRFGWMCAFGPNVRRDGQAFAAWLSEPGMQARVLAAPERMARLIGPILTATGQARPEWFPKMSARGNSSPDCGEGAGWGMAASDPNREVSASKTRGLALPTRGGGFPYASPSLVPPSPSLPAPNKTPRWSLPPFQKTRRSKPQPKLAYFVTLSKRNIRHSLPHILTRRATAERTRGSPRPKVPAAPSPRNARHAACR